MNYIKLYFILTWNNTQKIHKIAFGMVHKKEQDIISLPEWEQNVLFW